MSDDHISESFSFVLAAIGFGIICFIFVVVIPVGLAILIPIAIVGSLVFGAFNMYYNSPARAERIAKEKTYYLYNQVKGSKFPSEEELLHRFVSEARCDVPFDVFAQAGDILFPLLARELALSSIPEPPAICNSVEGARYRDYLSKLGGQTDLDVDGVIEAAYDVISLIGRHLPPDVPDAENADMSYSLRSRIDDLPCFVQSVSACFYTHDNLFLDLKRRLDEPLERLGKLPAEYTRDDVVEQYWRNVPLAALLDIQVPFAISLDQRKAHQHIVGMTGSMKTQLIQGQILDDIAAGYGVVVIDSQREMIPALARCDLIPADKLVWIDPSDIEWPVALNLFDISRDRLTSKDLVDREEAFNQVSDLYKFIFASLLDAEMTSRQETAFEFVIQLVLCVPNATIHTLREMFEPDAGPAYDQYVAQLSQTAQSFFRNEFFVPKGPFRDTKDQVRNRLYSMLRNRTFENLFSHSENKLNLRDEMEQGKVILIDTSEKVLGQACSTFGRFFIALVVQAVQDRSRDNIPTFLYIDEAYQYFGDDNNLDTILVRARKRNLGLVVAHQYLGQLTPKLARSLSTNTAVKCVGRVSPEDARVLAGQLRVDTGALLDTSSGTFVIGIDGVGTVTKKVEYGRVEKAPVRSREAQDALKAAMRARYCVPLSSIQAKAPPAAPPPEPESAPKSAPAASPASRPERQAEPEIAARPEPEQPPVHETGTVEKPRKQKKAASPPPQDDDDDW